MITSIEVEGPDLLGWWIRQPNRRGRYRTRRHPAVNPAGLRFVFYGRMSTKEWQDRLSSARWQRDFAEDTVDGRGVIIGEFFDVGCSRRLRWALRPQAALLIEALASPERNFDAIIVGECERAFCADEVFDLLPLFARYGVELWLPELNGPVDITNPMHRSLLSLLGVHSKREIQRARFRAKAAMRAQVIEHGRNLGGRPPYGYHLVEAGPHPNKNHARWGRKALRLEPHPDTAPHVRWMFAQRLAGRSVASIAHDLNARGVACPSKMDRERNPHRSGEGWTLRTVAAILANPRYTGRQVWNKQRTDQGPLQNHNDVLGEADKRRWNMVQQWAISRKAVHPPLVSEADFVAVQWASAIPTPPEGSGADRYLVAGLIRCEECGRILDSHWVNNHAAYRCLHGVRGAIPPGKPRIVYIHERKAIAQLADQLNLKHPCGQQVSERLLEHDALVTCGVGGTITLQQLSPAGQAHSVAPIPSQRLAAETPGRTSHVTSVGVNVSEGGLRHRFHAPMRMVGAHVDYFSGQLG